MYPRSSQKKNLWNRYIKTAPDITYPRQKLVFEVFYQYMDIKSIIVKEP